MATKIPVTVITGFLGSGKTSYIVGWIEERNPTKSLVILGFTIAQPNLHFLKRQVLPWDEVLLS